MINSKPIIFAVILSFVAIFCLITILMWKKPQLFVEWFYNKASHWTGLHTSIVDEKKFKDFTRKLAYWYLFIAIVSLFGLILGFMSNSR